VHDGRALPSGPRMHGEPGGLVDDQQIGVVVEHGQVERHRVQPRRRHLRDADPDPSPRRGAMRTGGGLPIHVHQTLRDQLLHAGAGEVGKARGDQLVEPLSSRFDLEGALLGDGPGRLLLLLAVALTAGRASPRAHQIFDLMCPLRARITSMSARSKKLVVPRRVGFTRLS